MVIHYYGKWRLPKKKHILTPIIMLNLYKTYYTIHKISAKMNNESFK